jgi:LuxR family maltose regulon positive regulatory protein
VSRKPLLDRLEKNRRRPLSLVCAPAGYGKSTLLSSWLETSVSSSSWLTLDENDNDLELFITYFVAALQTQFPDALKQTTAMTNCHYPLSLEALANCLINEINQICHPFVLILDDYHLLRNNSIHKLVFKLLQYQPRPLHLVLSTRFDPPLQLPLLRARNQITEIRMTDLRFSLEETERFIGKVMGREPDSRMIAELKEKTEGWAAGIRLAMFAIRHNSDLKYTVSTLPFESRYISDFLFTEVLAAIPLDLKDYLLTSSILDRFCAPLCEALCPPVDRQMECKAEAIHFINWLKTSELFVVPLDEQGLWFRYHHIFKHFLQQWLKRQCGEREITGLHRQASQWFAENSLIEEAIRHALAGKDPEKGAVLVERNRHQWLNEDKFTVLERSFNLLPYEIVRYRPKLLMVKAWIACLRYNFSVLPYLLEAVEMLSGNELADQGIEGEFDALQAILLFWKGRIKESVQRFQRAICNIPEQCIGVRNEVEIYIATASQMLGQGEEAARIYKEKLFNEKSDGTRKARIVGSLIFIYLLEGNLDKAETYLLMLVDLGNRICNSYILGWGYYLLGYICYVRNDLTSAGRHFLQAIENRYSMDLNAPIDSYVGLLLVYQATEQPDQLHATVREMVEFARQSNIPESIDLTNSALARLSILEGDAQKAQRYLNKIVLKSDTGPILFWLESPAITECRVLVETSSETSLKEAIKKIERLWRLCKETHNTPQMIELLLLEAMTMQRLHQPQKALAALEKAVMLAQPGGFVRPFMNSGKPIADLLKQLLQTNRSVDAVQSLLGSFYSLESAAKPADSFNEFVMQPWENNQAIDNPLTNREFEIIEFLGQGLKNKEIAAKLFISSETVKRHTANIFRKFDVHTRQQAVLKALRQGILNQNK